MAPLKLYWGSGSTPAWRVLCVLEEKGLDYESKLIEFSKSELLHDVRKIINYISHFKRSVAFNLSSSVRRRLSSTSRPLDGSAAQQSAIEES